jgi:dTDP-4-dehydrorhamnose reductase
LAQTRSMLDGAMPEAIINTAALADVDECERHPQRAYLGNVRIVENLATWIAASGGHCHLVQLSTDQVYDGPGDHRENDVTISNYYGMSKYAGELAAAVAGATVVRTNFFGPAADSARRSWSDWLVESLTTARRITVFEDVQFSPLSLSRLAALLESAAIRRRSGTYNLGSKHGMTKADFAFALAAALQLPTLTMARGSSADLKLTAPRPKGMCMDSSRFEQKFAVALPTLQEEIDQVTRAYATAAR